MAPLWRWPTWSWGPLFAISWLGCSDEGDTSGNGGDGGGSAGGGGAAALAFDQGGCGQCLSTECASLAPPCLAEPDCADHLECVGACPATDAGLPEPSCKDACPVPSEGAALTAIHDYRICADGSAHCEACGHGSDGENPYDDQQCAVIEDPNPYLECWLNECCDTGAQCFTTNPACDALYVCIQNCPASIPYHQCMSGCFDQHPAGVHDYLDDLACSIAMCETPQAPTPCSDCVQEHCSDALSACFLDPGCIVLFMCVAECTTEECLSACASAAPTDSLALFEAHRICSTQECDVVCD
jgi:hypothetical protein